MNGKSAIDSKRSASPAAVFSPQPITSTRTLADQVTEALTNRIVGNEFPGSQLPSEQAMAEGFGVSRTVIREAVSRLKAGGLIDTRQGRGAFVRTDRLDVPFRIDLNSKDLLGSLLHIIELRRGLDAEIAFLAATRRKREQMTAIRRTLTDIEKASKAGRDAAAEDLAFHLSIARATGNPLFLELLRFLNQFLYIAIRVTRANEDMRVEYSEQTRVEHMAIAGAIERQDPEAAATAAKIHMINAAVRIKSADAEFWTVELRHLAQSLDNEGFGKKGELEKSRRSITRKSVAISKTVM
ncbi:MAG TPA: FadR/GntR family transcriptional regulator [Terracidiphilus sp.]|jgi:DNA-binding FadR family transcriptional regulator|nr:FadR/GntR family transcriptional regulator [Terracidiphilus sp.]